MVKCKSVVQWTMKEEQNKGRWGIYCLFLLSAFLTYFMSSVDLKPLKSRYEDTHIECSCICSFTIIQRHERTMGSTQKQIYFYSDSLLTLLLLHLQRYTKMHHRSLCRRFTDLDTQLWLLSSRFGQGPLPFRISPTQRLTCGGMTWSRISMTKCPLMACGQ